MSIFKDFAAKVAARFNELSAGELFVVDIPGDEIWQAYLAAFPEGTNPIYRVRTEHDGSYDRAFVRRLGNVVSIDAHGQLQTIWGLQDLPFPYSHVCAVLDAKVKNGLICRVFRSKERKVGVVSNVELLDGGATHRWYHFHADIAQRHYARSVDETVGQFNTDMGVFQRALDELDSGAIDTVLELIDQNALYRGAEFAANVRQFRTLQLAYKGIDSVSKRNRFVWGALVGNSRAVTLVRNSVIGTLLVDLSEGKDLEEAVKAYEQKVAPANYRRPTALITQRMVDDAAKTIADLGLEPALDRRFARISDITVNNVLWVDNDVQSRMKDGIAGLLAKDVKESAKPPKLVTDVTPEEFLQDILPKVRSMEILFANSLQGNLVSLTAPVRADAPKLFKWDNGFAWSYNGNITDSIQQKVKAAGGNIDAPLRVSLAWYNHDDLDLHSQGPDGHVYFGDKRGILDVDMNAGGGATRSPVENQAWRSPRPGNYEIYVNQYCRRETQDVGFTLQLACNGTVQEFAYPKAVRGTIRCLRFTYANGQISHLNVLDKDLVPGVAQGVERWGLKTETFVKVNTLLLSPNYWDDQAVGNKHLFFILEGCANDEPARGIYNEFLRPELEKHRKVFEVLGNRTKCQPDGEQLSGLGFSFTQRNTATVRVKGDRLNATFNIKF